MRHYKVIPLILSTSLSYSCSPIPDTNVIDKTIEYFSPQEQNEQKRQLEIREQQEINPKKREIIPNRRNNQRRIMLA